MAKKKLAKKGATRLIRRPGYQYTLHDLEEMVWQLGGRLHVAIYPKEFDSPPVVQPSGQATGQPPSVDAVDPHVASTGKLSTREK